MLRSILFVFLGLFCVTKGQYGSVKQQGNVNKFSRNQNQMELVFQWKQIGYDGVDSTDNADFLFPEENSNSRASTSFIRYNNVPMGVDHHYGRVFITMPRRRAGIPSTLNYVDLNSKSKNQSPLLKPYPSATVNMLRDDLQPDPDRLISVYRTRIDECNRLWFVDTGLIEMPDNNIQVQRPSIWIIDLQTNQRIHRFELPSDVVAGGEGVASITVDVDPNNCANAFAYIPDLFYVRLYVYSLAQDRSWAFTHNYFRPDPLQGDFNVTGLEYQWDDGIFSITLGPRDQSGFREVYFHPMISTNEFAVSSQILQDEQAAERDYHGDGFRLLGTRGPGTQSTMHQYDLNSGIIFYSEISRNAIGCVNSALPITPNNHAIIAQNNATMVYPSDLKVDAQGTLWVFTNTMPRFIYSNLNVNEYNFRIWRARAADIVRGTICERK